MGHKADILVVERGWLSGISICPGRASNSPRTTADVHTPRAGRYWNLGVTDGVQKRGTGLL